MSEPIPYRVYLKTRLNHCSVPDSLHDGLIEYVAARRPMGGFLTAVASNDLMQACRRADPVNRFIIWNIVDFFTLYVTSDCWGTPERVAAWLSDDRPVPEVRE